MSFLKIVFLSLSLLVAFNECSNAQSSVSGCLTDGDSRLYANSIGNKDPYGGTSIPAYNGTPYVVDNRSFSDVACDTYYVFNKGGTNCVIYDNGGTVFQNKNGVISEIKLKVCNLPLDDLNWGLLSASVLMVCSVFRRQVKV